MGAGVSETELMEILATERIQPYFQPIVSLKQKKMVGVEALSRGMARDGQTLLPPAPLFAAAAQSGHALALDRLCRRKAVAAFSSLALREELLLFLNFDPAILTEGVAGSRYLEAQMATMGVDPSQVVIEIVESRVESARHLFDFVRFYRQLGCLIALDDFGDDHSNFGRVALLRPDIIKVSRSLVDGIAYDYYRRSVLAAIVSLAGKIGSLVLAEGVERFEDIMTCHELGADLMQGFFFSRPQPPEAAGGGQCCQEKIASVFEEMRHRLSSHYESRMRRQEQVNGVLTRVLGRLLILPPMAYDGVLAEVAQECEEVECFYVLGHNGLQVSDTVFRRPPKARNRLFAAAEKGGDHLLKGYYLAVAHSGMQRFCSEPYLSLASGNLCRTVSAPFSGIDGSRYILCMDLEA